ncbi:hypothetical protein AB7M42_008786 [Bradyrhizobium diazoefficiens]
MTLYHYTTAAGLQGIITSKSLWTSDYHFLNDASEFRYGWKIVVDAIDRREAEIKDRSSFAWQTHELFMRNRDKAFAFVGSLTSQGDLLSQWRGYNRGQGFAIGFNEDWLEQNAAVQQFEISRVLYDADEQRAAADTAVDLLIRQLADSEAEPTTTLERLNTWLLQAVKTALRLKDRHFSEEKESRLIWAGHNWPVRLKTRISPAGLIPYQAFQFNLATAKGALTHPNNFGVEEIVVGPALGQQQVIAVEALLASQSMRLEIRRSAIPYVAD